MTVDTTKPKKPRAKKPPTQTAGVTGIDAHGAMNGTPINSAKSPQIDWRKLINLPAFEMFVFEESGLSTNVAASNWAAAKRASMGDERLYELYANWHASKGFWSNETPLGVLIDKDI